MVPCCEFKLSTYHQFYRWSSGKFLVLVEL